MGKADRALKIGLSLRATPFSDEGRIHGILHGIADFYSASTL